MKMMKVFRQRTTRCFVIMILCIALTASLGVPIHPVLANPERSIPEHNKQVAIVIDDFGNRMVGTEKMLQLPVKITVAVMPFMQTTKEDAESAHRYGHDVIVHMPMEPMQAHPKWLGPGAIMVNQSDEEVEARVRQAIDNVPHAVGMNNHMGSKVTADKRIMRIVLKVCKEKGMFFLDSRTNYRSVIGEVGRELGVPVINNHLFLDDKVTEAHVSKQWSKVMQLLNKQNPFVVIGHVGVGGANTSAVLHRVIPSAQQHIQFVRVSELKDNPPPPLYTQ
ncbi:divergent polysaccharide deacetylase family protein [Paenibacillus marinisediminis]